MLKEYPVYFNDQKLPDPQKWEEEFETIENVNQTEAGTDQVLVVRYGKLTVTAQFNCSSRWAARFAEYRDAGPITVKSYDLKSADYKERRMRLRDFKSSPVEGSKNTLGTTGLYGIVFNLEEY